MFEDDPTPAPGDRFVVEDELGRPARDRRGDRGASAFPRGEIDLQFARDEGEGFESVQDWHEAHERFFERTIAAGHADRRRSRFRVVERL